MTKIKISVNIYEMVTNRILEQLKNGVIAWRKTWSGAEPINYISRKPYRGINLLLLPYGGEYLTFKQCKDAGGNVKKGEKSHMIVFYKMIEKENADGKKETFPLLQYSNVFHISQCEGIESKLSEVKANNDVEPIEAAQSVINNYINRSGVTLNHIEGSNSAFYRPSNDTITMPIISQFESAEEYYSTAFHEAAHSTGHISRLNRITEAAAFGSATYSREELTAEITACMIMNFTGIELQQTFENSAAYIQGWSKKLKEDVKAILTASSQAQKATDLILGITAG
jgi:antirestriction protein ArdC